MVQPVADRLADVHAHALQQRELCAEIREHFFTPASFFLDEFHFDLRIAHGLHVLIQFRATGAAAHEFDFRHAQDEPFSHGADAVALCQRGARRRGQVHRERTFIERWQEFRSEEGHHGQGTDDEHYSGTKDEPWPIQPPMQQARILLLQPAHQPTFLRMPIAFAAAEQVAAQRGCYRERYNERCKDAGYVGHTERHEDAAFDALQREERKEHEHHDDGGVHDGVAHFAARAEDDAHGGLRFRERPVLAQPSMHVLHIHDRIIDQLTDGDGQTAQRERVDTDAQHLEHNGRDEERERDRGERDHRGAHVQQEEEEDDDHEDRAIA